jgi:hypothetical protein
MTETDVLAFVIPVRPAVNWPIEPALSSVDSDPMPLCKSMLQCPLMVAELTVILKENGPLAPPTLKYVAAVIETALKVMKMNL